MKSRKTSVKESLQVIQVYYTLLGWSRLLDYLLPSYKVNCVARGCKHSLLVVGCQLLIYLLILLWSHVVLQRDRKSDPYETITQKFMYDFTSLISKSLRFTNKPNSNKQQSTRLNVVLRQRFLQHFVVQTCVETFISFLSVLNSSVKSNKLQEIFLVIYATSRTKHVCI